MTLAKGIYDYLSTYCTVGDHVYPWRLPKASELPCVTYQIIPAAGPLLVHSDAHDGSAPVESLFIRERVQWDAWAGSYIECEALGVELRHLLHAFRGQWGDLAIGSVSMDIMLDSYEEEVGVYRKIMDGMVRFNEVIAVAS